MSQAIFSLSALYTVFTHLVQGSNPDHEFCKLPKYKHLIVAAAKEEESQT